MLFPLGDLAEAGDVAGLEAYGPALEGALFYLATTLVLCGRPFPSNPSRYAALFPTPVNVLRLPQFLT
jgi:hypothetical protein